jgi:hypothetical protein
MTSRLGSKPCNHSTNNLAPPFDKAEAFQVVLSEPDDTSRFFSRQDGIFKKTGMLERHVLAGERVVTGTPCLTRSSPPYLYRTVFSSAGFS